MIHEILNKIQTTLKAPKGQVNKFGNYNYRSCEDILEAVKPLLKEHGATLVVNDDIVCVSDRVYVKATAKLTMDSESESVSASAFAREPFNRKGMDDSQITGATSSYARKYALNGLFCIDDNKDADTQDNSEENHRFKKDEADKIVAQTLECLEMGDDMGVKQIFAEYKSPEEKTKVWALFNSSQRDAITKFLKG